MKYTTNVKPSTEEDKETVVEGTGKLDFGEYELELWDLRYNGVMGRGGDAGRLEESGFVPRGSVSAGGGGRGARVGARGDGDGGAVRVAQQKEDGVCDCLSSWLVPGLLMGVSIIFILAVLPFTNHFNQKPSCAKYCRFEIVETIPEDLTFPPDSPTHKSIYSAWVDLLSSANSSVDIVAFYWTLLNDDVSPNQHFNSSSLGEDIFERIKETGLNKSVKIRIAQNKPSKVSPQRDSAILASIGAAKVRNLDFKRLKMGSGVLHTKLWIVDDTHVYIGSANMDWRSLTQVKEVGIVFYNCSALALDMKKIFDVYWLLGYAWSYLPPSWPPFLRTKFNMSNQMNLTLNGTLMSSYISSSPGPFNPSGRAKDHDAIVDIINKAEKFVYVSVMEYFPKTIYNRNEVRFWPVIDNALRAAAVTRGVKVRLLASLWNHTRSDQALYLRSLSVLTSEVNNVDIETRLFQVPSYTPEQEEIPFGRVNHDKYMVTDQVAYIGTSNWSADYFINTAGVGLVINDTWVQQKQGEGEGGGQTNTTTTPRQQLQALFERDWNSEYAIPTSDIV